MRVAPRRNENADIICGGRRHGNTILNKNKLNSEIPAQASVA
jgi:hypothetical protein